jgi:hypothetical protein
MGFLSKAFKKVKPKNRALLGKPRTQLIDPRLPRGKVGKGPLEPRDSTTRVPAERIKSSRNVEKKNGNTGYEPA